MAKPSRISTKSRKEKPWLPGTGQDPARYLINPGDVRAPGKHRPGNLRHARPYIVNGAKMFVFPVGTEGFRRSGQAQLALHHYIGGMNVDGRAMHYEEARIELTGTFPGITSQQNMVDCIHVLTSISPRHGLVLYCPGVFDREQYVLAETWDFSHQADDRTHSIDFSVSFVRKGTGKKVKDPHGVKPPPQPQRKSDPRGDGTNVFHARDGARTFNAIAMLLWHNSAYWKRLSNMNYTLVHRAKLPMHKVPTHRWPIGTKIHY